MSIETFLLFAAVFIVVMTALGIGLAVFAYYNSKKSMKDLGRRLAEISNPERRRFRP